MIPGETVLSGAEPPTLFRLQVLRSPAGWYIGTTEHGSPYSRESLYFRELQEAQEACDDWLVVADVDGASSTEMVSRLRRAYQAGMLVGART